MVYMDVQMQNKYYISTTQAIYNAFCRKYLTPFQFLKYSQFAVSDIKKYTLYKCYYKIQ